jgi:hypothetical protein
MENWDKTSHKHGEMEEIAHLHSAHGLIEEEDEELSNGQWAMVGFGDGGFYEFVLQSVTLKMF